MPAPLGPQSLDSTRQYALALSAPDGSSLAGAFTGAESFVAQLWPGGLAPASAAPAAAWDTSIAGNPSALASPVVLLTVASSIVAGLAPATYALQVLLSPDVEVWRGALRLVGAGGTAAVPLTYATEADMLLYAPWIEDAQSSSDLAGFGGQLARATSRLNEAIVSRYKGGSGGLSIGQPGYGAGVMLGGWGDPPPSKWLRDQLDAGKLIVRDQVREVVARWAIADVCDAQVGRDGETPYQALASRFRRRADALARSLRAEVDLDGDGYAEVFVNLGATDLR